MAKDNHTVHLTVKALKDLLSKFQDDAQVYVNFADDLYRRGVVVGAEAAKLTVDLPDGSYADVTSDRHVVVTACTKSRLNSPKTVDGLPYEGCDRRLSEFAGLLREVLDFKQD